MPRAAVLDAIPAAAYRLRMQRALAAQQAEQTPRLEPAPLDDWRAWLPKLFSPYLFAPFASYHEEFWEWVWGVERGSRPRPFVAVWPRGCAKSTSAELACVALAARQVRRYGLYVSETQERADDHVGNVAAMLESESVERYHPTLGERSVGKFGNPKGWRRNRLRTASGFTLDAIGLDSAARGAKVEAFRPDLMIFDDIDSELDGPAIVERKLTTLTRALLPAGAADLAIVGVQNLIHPDSVFARLVDGRAEFLADRILSGPHPALEGLAYEQREGRFVITAGEPTWEGMARARCQAVLDDVGLTSFLAEEQHEVEAPAGGMFDHLDFLHCEWRDVPTLTRVVVWVDPAVTDTDESDSHGIQADGIAADGTIYRLWSWEARTSPEDSLRRAIEKAVELKAECVGVETDQGGDTWKPTYREAARRIVGAPPFRSAKAGAGHGPKVHRAAQMLADYEKGRIVHVIGTHQALERALRRFPKTKPFDLTDAAYWSWHDLRHGVKRRLRAV